MDGPPVEFIEDGGRVTIRGECDMSDAPAMKAWLRRIENPIALDLSGVTFLDSSFLHLLLQLKQKDERLQLVNPSAVVVRLLQMTGTYDFLVGESRPEP
jgi:anti-anti-sigma factor